MDGSSERADKSVVGRASRLLRVVARFEPAGVRTSEAARLTELPRPTAHRLLSELNTEGFVSRDPASGRWILGPEVHFMGLAASPRYDVRDIGLPIVRSLADRTGESAFLSARRGLESICLIREDGAFPVRSHVLFEGARFPLGVASAGMAFLAFMHPREIDNYLETVDLEPTWGFHHSPSALRHRIAETRQLGYVVNPGLVVPGSWGMAAAVFDAAEGPQWALSLTGIEHRFGPDRQPELGNLLLREAHRLSKLLSGRASRTPD